MDKDCPPGKVINPHTGRCIDANGKLAISLGLNKKQGDLVYEHKIIEQLIEEITKKGANFLNDPGLRAKLEKVFSKEIVAAGKESIIDALTIRIINLDNAKKLNLPINHIWHYLPLEDIRHIAAMSFYKYKLGDKTFFLVGENHFNIGLCDASKQGVVFITGLVRALTEHFKHRTYDFFTEMSYLKAGGFYTEIQANKASIGMNLISEQYKHCLDIGKPRKCGDNLRVHYTDYRTTIDRAKIDKFMSQKTTREEVEKQINEFLSSNKMKKQYAEIKDEKLRTSIYEWFAYDKLPRDDYSPIRSISAIMDMYTAGRMFRSFNDYTAKNIIYYAGAAHIDNMAELLRYLGAREEMAIDGLELDDYVSCIELKDPVKIFN